MKITENVGRRQIAKIKWWWFFNGIPTFVGYSLPKPFLQKCSGGTISPIAGEVSKGVPTFPLRIYPKVNVLTRVVFEFANYDPAVQHVSHPAKQWGMCSILKCNQADNLWVPDQVKPSK